MDTIIQSLGQERVDDNEGRVRIDKGNGRLVIFDGSNNLAVLGYDDNGDVVVKIAKPGFDANNAADANLVFNSQQNTFKIVAQGNATVVLPPGSYNAVKTWTTTIPHGLPFAPAISAYVDLSTLPALAASSGLSPVPGYGITPTAGLGTNVFLLGYVANVSVDATNLYFTVSWLYGSLTLASITRNVQFKYYILQETAQ